MAALRSLAPELAQEIAAWQREFDRRLKDSHVCIFCGDDRAWCVCEEDRRTFSNESRDEVGGE